jgi:hypothetical protein
MMISLNDVLPGGIKIKPLPPFYLNNETEKVRNTGKETGI